jgi:arylsulfatase A-like enzyme
MTDRSRYRAGSSTRRHALALALLACACSPAEAPRAARPHNLIVVVFDTTRYDDWSYMAPERKVTPVLDAIGQQGVRFSNAWSLYSVTVPSHVSLFTGRAASFAEPNEATSGEVEVEVGVEVEVDYVGTSIFTILRDHGYRTYAFAGNDNIRVKHVEALEAVDASLTGTPKGKSLDAWRATLELYGEGGPGSLATSRQWHERRRSRRIILNHAEYVNDVALASMQDHAQAHADQPYLLFLNYNDAHDPYFPTPPWNEAVASPADSHFNGNLWNPTQRRRNLQMSGLKLSMTADGLSAADIERARALHLGELAYADAQFGALLAKLEALGLMRDTVVVALADHGEAFGEEGRMAHSGLGGAELQEALLHVPMLMRFPVDVPGERIIAARVDLRDVKPTLLAYLGIGDTLSRGRNLLPLLRGEATQLAPAALRPQDRDPNRVGDNLIHGQKPEMREQLEAELHELGYIE